MATVLDMEQQDIEKARHAFRDYVTWSYVAPAATPAVCLAQQYYQVRQHRLSSAAQVYFSVLVNEFHGPSVSGKEYDADDAR